MTPEQSRVVTHLQDAYAMEQNVLGMLDSIIATTDDGFSLTIFQHHRDETARQIARIHGRLGQLGEPPSLTKSAMATVGSIFKSAIDTIRPEKACKNLRDAFITEHGEIAGYELLERYAQRANDAETFALAQQNKEEEIAMARRLEGLWDRAVDHDLRAVGVPVETVIR
jgi:ferritin-like metal-binding protein YciE